MKKTSLTILSILLSLAITATTSAPEYAKANGGAKTQTMTGGAKKQPKGSKGAKYLKKRHTGKANFTSGGKKQF